MQEYTSKSTKILAKSTKKCTYKIPYNGRKSWENKVAMSPKNKMHKQIYLSPAIGVSEHLQLISVVDQWADIKNISFNVTCFFIQPLTRIALIYYELPMHCPLFVL